MTKTTFTIQNKHLGQIIFVIVLLVPLSLAAGILANYFTANDKTLFVFICLSIIGFFSCFLIRQITTTVFHIIVDDQILSIEEKTSNGKIKYYTVNLADINKLYYRDHCRDREIISLKIKLVDSHNQTKLKIRSSELESAKGMGKENIKNLVAFSTLIFAKLNIDIKCKGKYHVMSNVREYTANQTNHLR